MYHGSILWQKFVRFCVWSSLTSISTTPNNFTTTRNIGASEISKTVSYLLSLFYELSSLNDVPRECLLSSHMEVLLPVQCIPTLIGLSSMSGRLLTTTWQHLTQSNLGSQFHLVISVSTWRFCKVNTWFMDFMLQVLGGGWIQSWSLLALFMRWIHVSQCQIAAFSMCQTPPTATFLNVLCCGELSTFCKMKLCTDTLNNNLFYVPNTMASENCQVWSLSLAINQTLSATSSKLHHQHKHYVAVASATVQCCIKSLII